MRHLIKISVFFLAVFLTMALLTMPCYARGSASSSSLHSSAGYSSGSYSSAVSHSSSGSSSGSSYKSSGSSIGSSSSDNDSDEHGSDDEDDGSGSLLNLLGSLAASSNAPDTSVADSTPVTNAPVSTPTSTTHKSSSVVVIGSTSNGPTAPGGHSNDTGILIGLLFVALAVVAIFWAIYLARRLSEGKASAYQRQPEATFDFKKGLAKYKELYATLIFGVDDVQDYIEKADLDKRRCVKLLPVLKEYVDILNSGNIQSATAFKAEHSVELVKLTDCAKCKCLKCSRDCKMSGCTRCEPAHRCKIVSCDNKTVAVYTFSCWRINLFNDDLGRNEELKVLAVVEDIEYKQLYIVLERGKEKVVLYYYPGINGDTYGKITDTEDLEFAVNAFEGIYL